MRAFVSSFANLRSAMNPSMHSQATPEDIYLEAHGIHRAVAAAVSRTVEEASADPIARVAVLLGETSVQPMLDRMASLDRDVEALLLQRSELVARVAAIDEREDRLATLQTENAALRKRVAQLIAQCERNNSSIRQHEENSATIVKDLKAERLLVQELSAKSTADETLMNTMGRDCDAARARVYELEQDSASGAGLSGASQLKRVLVL